MKKLSISLFFLLVLFGCGENKETTPVIIEEPSIEKKKEQDEALKNAT